jgi:hypothetical protein
VRHSTLIFNCHYQKAKGNLSKLVNLNAARKPISDARATTYLILSTGSGPGGRWFKSTRPDQPLESVTYIAQKSYERLVVSQKVAGSNLLAPTR